MHKIAAFILIAALAGCKTQTSIELGTDIPADLSHRTVDRYETALPPTSNPAAEQNPAKFDVENPRQNRSAPARLLLAQPLQSHP